MPNQAPTTNCGHKREVRKYPLDARERRVELPMPAGARILRVGESAGRIAIWAEVDPDAVLATRILSPCMTGESIPAGWCHLGSGELERPDEPGKLVVHVYEDATEQEAEASAGSEHAAQHSDSRTPLRVIRGAAPPTMSLASVAAILDGLDGEPLRAVWGALVEALTSGAAGESDEVDARWFFLEPGQRHVLARQLHDYRYAITRQDPITAAELSEAADNLSAYLIERVELGFCRPSAGEGGEWFSAYVDVPAGLDDAQKAAAAVRAGEQRAQAEAQEVVHVFVHRLHCAPAIDWSTTA